MVEPADSDTQRPHQTRFTLIRSEFVKNALVVLITFMPSMHLCPLLSCFIPIGYAGMHEGCDPT